MDNRRAVIVEAFVLCGMACSRIDDEFGLVPGYAHDVVTSWWLDGKLGRRDDAVRRWVIEAKAFAASRSELVTIEKKGVSTTWAWAMAQGALSYLPEGVAAGIRVERIGDRVIARKVGRDGQ